jgi:alpha-galactosidase/6-phospho-beta-glucosidase family protein
MKIAYIGAGALRLLPDIRLLLQNSILCEQDEIALYDLLGERSELMEQLIRQCPEFQGKSLSVQVYNSLEPCLEDADFVYLVIRPWRLEILDQTSLACLDAGLLGTDNVSLSGSLMAGIGIPIVLDLARKMETLCPKAWLLIFSNPIGLLTYAVRRATRIRAVGVCAGYANHFFDLANIMNQPAPDYNYDVEVAGINHFSWILSCRYQGQEFYPLLDEQIKKGIDFHWLKEKPGTEYLVYFLSHMIEAYKRYGVMLYSSEPDGLPRLGFYHEFVERHRRYVLKSLDDRKKFTQDPWYHLQALAKRGVPAAMWDSPESPFPPIYTQRSIGPLLIGGLSGREILSQNIVVSLPNNGAIKEFPDESVMEYSVKVENGDLIKANTFSLPSGLIGLTRSLVEHQTLVAEGILREDFNLFRQGMFAYPLLRSFREGDDLIERLLHIAQPQLPDFFKKR